VQFPSFVIESVDKYWASADGHVGLRRSRSRVVGLHLPKDGSMVVPVDIISPRAQSSIMLHPGSLPGHEGSVVGGAGSGSAGVFRTDSRGGGGHADLEEDHENVVIGEAM
jgi:hypothetical protein